MLQDRLVAPGSYDVEEYPMTERHVERASIDSLYNAKDKRYPQDASPSTGREIKEEQTRIPNSDQILIEVNKEFNDEAKFTVVKRINQNV